MITKQIPIDVSTIDRLLIAAEALHVKSPVVVIAHHKTDGKPTEYVITVGASDDEHLSIAIKPVALDAADELLEALHKMLRAQLDKADADVQRLRQALEPKATP